MPTPRKKATISNYDFMRALLYIIENGCKWRALPKEYGNWHTIYVRFNRWSKNGTIDKIFEELQKQNIIEIRTQIVCIDSTSIKVHPDAAGARKSNGEQSIGRSKGGSQQRFIWLPRLPNMSYHFVYLPGIAMMPLKDESSWNQYIRKTITVCLWTELTKMTKHALLLKSKGLFLLCLRNEIEKNLGIMIKNFTNAVMKLKDISSELNVLEKFLPVMTNLILSILLLFILL